MYCKKCNINVKKDKKVCPRCGTALVPGEVKGNPAKRLRNIVIIASAVAVAVIALFLGVFLAGRVPPELKGTWYETTGMGYSVFKPNGVIIMTAMENETEGSYSFNSTTDQGTVTIDGDTSTFTCDGTTIDWEGSILTKTYVEQLDFDSMFSGLTG